MGGFKLIEFIIGEVAYYLLGVILAAWVFWNYGKKGLLVLFLLMLVMIAAINFATGEEAHVGVQLFPSDTYLTNVLKNITIEVGLEIVCIAIGAGMATAPNARPRCAVNFEFRGLGCLDLSSPSSSGPDWPPPQA